MCTCVSKPKFQSRIDCANPSYSYKITLLKTKCSCLSSFKLHAAGVILLNKEFFSAPLEESESQEVSSRCPSAKLVAPVCLFSRFLLAVNCHSKTNILPDCHQAIRCKRSPVCSNHKTLFSILYFSQNKSILA